MKKIIISACFIIFFYVVPAEAADGCCYWITRYTDATSTISVDPNTTKADCPAHLAKVEDMAKKLTNFKSFTGDYWDGGNCIAFSRDKQPDMEVAEGIRAKTIKSISGGSGGVGISNPLGSGATPQVVMGRALKAVLGLVGSIALVIFIYGGVLWMTAAGNDQNVGKAQKTLLWGAIGLVVVFSAYALVVFVLKDALGVIIK